MHVRSSHACEEPQHTAKDGAGNDFLKTYVACAWRSLHPSGPNQFLHPPATGGMLNLVGSLEFQHRVFNQKHVGFSPVGRNIEVVGTLGCTIDFAISQRRSVLSLSSKRHTHAGSTPGTDTIRYV